MATWLKLRLTTDILQPSFKNNWQNFVSAFCRHFEGFLPLLRRTFPFVSSQFDFCHLSVCKLPSQIRNSTFGKTHFPFSEGPSATKLLKEWCWKFEPHFEEQSAVSCMLWQKFRACYQISSQKKGFFSSSHISVHIFLNNLTHINIDIIETFAWNRKRFL